MTSSLSPPLATFATFPQGRKTFPSKQAQWAKTRFGIDLNNDFTPIYIVSDSSKKQVRLLKQLLKDADELYLATDEDREGEAIAWHLLEELKPKVPVQGWCSTR